MLVTPRKIPLDFPLRRGKYKSSFEKKGLRHYIWMRNAVGYQWLSY